MSSLPFREFDIQGALHQGKNIMILGRRGTGKSSLVCDMLHKGQYFFGTMLTHPYNDITNLPLDICLCRNDDINERDTHITNHMLNASQAQGKPTALVLEDCIYDMKTVTKLLAEAFATGTNNTTIITMQYPLSISSSFRFDYVFILYEPIKSNRLRLWERYGYMFATYDLFSLAMDHVTVGTDSNHLNYTAMVIDCRTYDEPKEITDLVFWYKAPELIMYVSKPESSCDIEFDMDDLLSMSTL